MEHVIVPAFCAFYLIAPAFCAAKAAAAKEAGRRQKLGLPADATEADCVAAEEQVRNANFQSPPPQEQHSVHQHECTSRSAPVGRCRVPQAEG